MRSQARAYSALTIFLCFIFLLFCPAVYPGDIQPLFDQGIILFENGKYRKAYDIFYRLFEEYPDNPRINFMLGRACFEAGEMEQAVMIYDRMLITNPGLERVRLEMAQCYMHLGAFETAIALFKKVLESGPPEAVKKNIERYMVSAEASVKRHHISGMLRGFTGWDDNPQVLPDNPLIRVPLLDNRQVVLTDKKESELFYGNLFKLTHRYTPYGKPYGWETSATSYNLFYDSLDGEDLNFLSIETGPYRTWKKSGARLKIVQGRLDREYDRYSGTTGIGASFFYLPGSAFLLNSDLTYEYRDYQEHGRDSHIYYLSFQPFFTHGNISFFLKTSYEREIAELSRYDLSRVELIPGAVGTLPGNYQYRMAGQYAYSWYDDINTSFLIYREDHLIGFTAAVSKKIWGSKSLSFALALDYLYNRVYSNIDLNDYTKNRITLSMIFEF